MTDLASFLESKSEIALERWVARIRVSVAPDGKTEAQLRDHIPLFLSGLVGALRKRDADAESPSGKEHGRQRFRLGFDIESLIREYGILRNILFDLIEGAQLTPTLAELRTVTDFLTNAIAESVVEYNRQGADKMHHLQLVAEAERRKLEAFFETAPVGICINEGRDLHYTFANAAYRETVGGREVVGKSLFAAIPEIEGQPFPALLEQVMQTGKPIFGNAQPARILHDGRTVDRFYNFVFAPKRDVNGVIDGVIQYAFDVTTEIEALQRSQRLLADLARSEDRRMRIVAASGAGVWEMDLRAGVIDMDARARALHGLPAEGVITIEAGLASVHDPDRDSIAKAVSAAVSPTSNGTYQFEFRTDGGGAAPLRWLEGRGGLHRDPAGKPLYLAGTTIDITARKEAERERELLALEVRTRQERWRTLTDALPLLVAFVNADERYVLLNKAYETWFGSAREELIGRSVREVIGDAAYAILGPHVQRALSGETFSFERHDVPYRNGGVRDVKVIIIAQRDAAGTPNGYVSLLEDITDARRALAENDRVARQRTEVLEAMGDAFFALDAEFRFILVNRRYEELSRKRREETIGRRIWDLFPETATPESNYFRSYDRCMRERIPISFLDYHEALDLWTDVRSYPTGDGGISVFFRDVTSEKRVEKSLHEGAELEQQLIGIVSHDLRNPLNVIQLASSLLKRDEEIGAASTKLLVRIQNASERANRMVADLLDFTQARLGGGIGIQPRAMDFHELVRNLVDEVSAAYPTSDVVVTHAGDGRGEWDPDRLGQVIQNLVSNALKYSTPGSVVQVATSPRANAVSFVVHNEGPPIPADKLPIVFEPFQRAVGSIDKTTKSVGLGLYIVKQIVDAHHGTVTVESTEAGGTTFRVELPRS